MILKKCLDQNYISFRDFFVNGFIDDSSLFIKRTKSNKDLVNYLENINDDLILYGFTSHERICIVDGKYTNDQCFLVINSNGYDKTYNIEFLLPSEILGWENAWVKITVGDKNEVYMKVLDALKIRFE